MSLVNDEKRIGQRRKGDTSDQLLTTQFSSLQWLSQAKRRSVDEQVFPKEIGRITQEQLGLCGIWNSNTPAVFMTQIDNQVSNARAIWMAMGVTAQATWILSIDIHCKYPFT